MSRRPSILITKEDVKTVYRMWETHNIEQIADELGWPKVKVSHVASQIRKLGHKLAVKRVNGQLNHLIAEALDEL